MSDREESPDWLREFKAPTRSFVTLSSSSDSSADDSDRKEPEPRHDKSDAIQIDGGEDDQDIKAEQTKKLKTRKSRGVGEGPLDANEEELGEEDTTEKRYRPPISSRLPLVFPDKVQRSKALVECDGDSIDLSGDVGAVGRVVISNGPTGNHEMLLDLKGTVYKSTIVPSRTFCIVSVGQSEAKIEAIMNDFIKLEPQSNVFEAETMIEGTLEGFSFDSDEEGDKVPKPSVHQSDQNNEMGDQAKPKTKRKADKPSRGCMGKGNKKAKAAVRPSKTVKKTKKSKK